MRKSLLKRAIFQLHLWGGLALGVYAFLIGITGSVLVFREEIVDHLLAPPPKVADSPATPNLEEIRAGIQWHYPGWNIWSLEAPHSLGAPWSSYILRNGQGRLVFADAQGTVVGERNLKGTWLELAERFHSNLLIPRRGRLYNGIAGVILAVLAFSGLMLWWPARGDWSSAFRIVRRSNWKGINYDLHRVGGAITLAFVLLFCITGAYFTWAAVYRDIAASVLPTKSRPQPAIVRTDGTRMPVDDLVAAAEHAVPDTRFVRVLVPQGNNEAVTVVLAHGAIRNNRTTTQLRLNPHTAEVLSIDDYRERRAGDHLVSWIPQLHTGHFGNTAVKIVWAVAGLSLPALFVTGFLMWCNRVLAPRIRRTTMNEQCAPVSSPY
jgi:uncharacterized iron-regulated membrane protein